MEVSTKKISDPMSTQFAQSSHSRRLVLLVRICLVGFGVLLGLGAIELALRFLPILPRGSEFDSLADLRHSILAGITSDESSAHRTVTLGGIILPHPDDQIIYDLKPNIDVTFQGVPTRTNSCGMRWRETSIAKPAGTYRIALLGDSFAFGWGVPEDKGFARVLEDTLNGISQGRPHFEVINFGVPGYSTFQEVALLKERGLDFDPDAVIVYFVDNDFGLPFFIRDHSSSSQLTDALSFTRKSRDSDGEQATSNGRLPVADPSRALLELASLAKERGTKIYLAINPRKSWEKIQSRLWALKQLPEITVMPLIDDLITSINARAVPDDELQLKGDPHPGVAKHKILGEIMAPYFIPVIESQAR